ncbi:hypothetical protein [Cognatishimia maritima]|uniref:Flp pilus assembly protein, pilin Flp n=1 Tax=Cognatishimia maritima TaxID=870908 RepID=A0A1M5KUF2_9RHOB|nr:hypothetical protein [Cognatishimia maritima]SHG56398.1 hypothetical protein SAMN04488044_1077 [Cognatishimia maritima]
MRNYLKTFMRDENGAVTVDWVVLTAVVVGMAVAVHTLIETETGTLANNIGATIAAHDTTAAAGATGVAGE